MANPPALRVLKLTGEVVVTLTQSELSDLSVRKLRTEIATLLGRHPEETHFILGLKVLDEDELLSPLLPTSGVLDLTLTLEQLPPFDPQRPAVEQLQALRVLLGSPKPEETAFAAKQVRLLVSKEDEPPIQQVVSAGLVPRLVELCTVRADPCHTDAAQDAGEVSSTTIVQDAAWALTNIASGTSHQTRAVVEHGGIENFVSLLDSHTPDLHEQAVWGLGNIAGDSAEMRDAVLSAGCLGHLADLYERQPSMACQENIFWTIGNLCRGRPKVALEQVLPALPMLARTLSSEGAMLLTDALWALCYISTDSYEGIQAVLETGLLPRIVQLLRHTEASVQKPALDTVLSIAKGTDAHKQNVLDTEILDAIWMLRSRRLPRVQDSVYSLIATLAGGTSAHIQALVVSGLLQVYFSEVLGDVLTQTFAKMQEACNVVQNVAARGTPEQMDLAFSDRIIECLLERMRSDHSFVRLALQTFKAMLVAGCQMQQARGLAQNPYVDLLQEHRLEEELEDLPESARAGGEFAEMLAMLKGKTEVSPLHCE